MSKSTFYNILRILQKDGFTKINIRKPIKTNQNQLKNSKSEAISNTKLTIIIKSTKMIKSGLAFELTNQFLVKVAQKVITLSNFGFLFIKHYKERLNS